MGNAVAKTLEQILDNPIVATALDRSKDIRETVDKVVEYWSVDLSKRHPAPAVIETEEGLVHAETDLDLFSFLAALSQRNAVINIPSYDNLRKSTLKSNEVVVGTENRHGQLFGVRSNANTHSFPVLIKDYNVMKIVNGKEIIGSSRHFSVVDDSGHLYEGWSNIGWNSTAAEDKFISDNRLEAFQGSLDFNYFVHPNRAFSFYGSPYIASKILARRITDQASFYRRIANQLLSEGITFLSPSDKRQEDELTEGGTSLQDQNVERQDEVTYESRGEMTPVKVTNLEAKLLIPDFHGEYPLRGMEDENGNRKIFHYDKMPDDRENKARVLRYSKVISDRLSYTYGPRVRTPVRATELAFFLYGTESRKEREIKPGWDVPEWNRDYREGPRTRIHWNQLVLNENVQLLYRIRQTTAQVRSG